MEEDYWKLKSRVTRLNGGMPISNYFILWLLSRDEKIK